MKNQYDYIVGIDISKDYFCARIIQMTDSLATVDIIQKFDNSKNGFLSFLKWLNKSKVNIENCLIVMEATGIYWENLAFFCVKEGIKVSVVNPKQIKHFAHTNLRRSKTDPLDADLIARFGAIMNPTIWNPPDPIIEELKQIARERDSFVKMQTEEKNRLHSLKNCAHPSPDVLKAHECTINYLERQIKRLEKIFKDKLTGKPELEKKINLLKTIPGIGNISAGILLTEANEFATFTSAKQLTAYAGISPSQCQSGSSVNKKTKISKIGNSRIRSTLYLNALTCIRAKSSPFKVFYERLREKGKPAKVALVAVARKLLHLAFAILKSGIPFDPCYISKKPAFAS